MISLVVLLQQVSVLLILLSKIVQLGMERAWIFQTWTKPEPWKLGPGRARVKPGPVLRA